MSDREWTRYVPAGNCTRVIETSCCNAYALLQEGGAYVVTRSRPHAILSYEEETARGAAGIAKDVFRALVDVHLTETQKHRP